MEETDIVGRANPHRRMTSSHERQLGVTWIDQTMTAGGARNMMLRPTLTSKNISEAKAQPQNMDSSLLTLKNVYNLDEEVLACSLSRDENRIHAGCVSGEIKIFDVGNAQPIRQIAPTFVTTEDNSSVTAIKQRRRGTDPTVVATYAAGYILYWSTETGECLRTISEGQQIMGFTFHPREAKFLTFGDDAKIRLYDMELGKAIKLYENGYMRDQALGHNSRVFAATFNPRSINEFITGGWDNTVHFWDIRQPQSNKYIAGPHICGEGLDIDSKGDRLVTCAYQKANPVSLWSYRNGQLVVNIEHANYQTYCGRFISPKSLLIGTSEPAYIQILNTMSFQFTDTYKMPGRGVYCLDSATSQVEQESVSNFIVASGSTITQFQYVITQRMTF